MPIYTSGFNSLVFNDLISDENFKQPALSQASLINECNNVKRLFQLKVENGEGESLESKSVINGKKRKEKKRLDYLIYFYVFGPNSKLNFFRST